MKFGDVAGLCHVVFSENLVTSVSEWTKEGPDRFYFSQAYNSSKQEFEDPPSDAVLIGFQGKVSCRISQCNSVVSVVFNKMRCCQCNLNSLQN